MVSIGHRPGLQKWHERTLELRVHLLDRRIADLHSDPADLELHEVRRRDRDRTRTAEGFAKPIEPVLWRQLVNVE